MYEFAGAIGIEPLRLFALNLRQFFALVKGFRRERALQESYHRKIFGLIAMVNRDPKKPAPNIDKIWPIPILDRVFDIEEDEEPITDIKTKLMKAWRLN